MSVIVVIPVYNEQECIAGVLKDWTKMVQPIPGSQVLVVNDGSKDGTGAVLDELARKEPLLKILHQPNGGHGVAVMNGYREALKLEPEWIFQCDSDDQIPASDFPRLWEKRGESPFILGRRYDRHDPLYRIILSRFNRFLVWLTFGVYLKDPNIPFRLMKTSFFKELYEVIAPMGAFAPNVFFSILAKRRGAQTLDIPITHKIRETGTPSLKPIKMAKICWRCAKELFALRLKA